LIGADGIVIPDWLDVSRETVALLEQFVELIEKWNPTINLVSRRSMSELWERHVLDSAQLFSLIPTGARHLVDLGSGGGFPGVVLAIMARDVLPELRFTLVEADQRKATFLSEVVRRLSLNCIVAAHRIEVLAPQNADVVTARALAPLTTLCGQVHRHLGPDGTALIAKGEKVDAELAETGTVWAFQVTRFASKLDPNAAVLAITGLRHV